MTRRIPRSSHTLAALLVVASTGAASGQATGPCCLPTGGCIETDLYSCAATGGQFLAGASCDDCATSVGACCLPGNCLLLAASDSSSCAAIGGSWAGAGTTCAACLDAPPACGDDDAGSCFRADENPGCRDGTCCAVVCAVDGFCCDTDWDETCADLATVVCGPAPDAVEAELPGINVQRGILLSGRAEDLVESDGRRVRVRAELLPGPPVRYRVDLRVVAIPPAGEIERLDVTTETGANSAGAETKVFLRDFAAGRWRRIARFDQPAADAERVILDVERPHRFVKDDGRMLLRIVMQRSASFVARVDRTTLGVVVEQP
ncbi:MAG: hypothetical protein ACYTJ0_11995 [Planctomycetota bacterium]